MFRIFVETIEVLLKCAQNAGTLCEGLGALIVLHQVVRMNNISDKSTENKMIFHI